MSGQARYGGAAAPATLLTDAAGCGHNLTPAQPSPRGQEAHQAPRRHRKGNPGTVHRHDDAANDATHSAPIPGAIIGMWGPQSRYVRAIRLADKARTDEY